MIRFIIIVIILFLYLILGIPVLGIEWLIGKFNKQAEDYQCLRMVQKAFRLMLKIAGTKITVIGEENIPDEAVLFIGNHRSYFDILLTLSLIHIYSFSDQMDALHPTASLPSSLPLQECTSKNHVCDLRSPIFPIRMHTLFFKLTWVLTVSYTHLFFHMKAGFTKPVTHKPYFGSSS